MVVTESGMAVVFSKASGLSHKHGSFTESVLQSIFASVRSLFKMSVKESVIGFVLSKVLGLY